MKSKTVTAIISIMLTLAITSCNQSKSAKEEGDKTNIISLFNGTDLTNWVFHLKDATVEPSDVFMVHGDVIHISGEPFGYMRTKETYSDYDLHLEYRWPVEATNSGVFIHTQLPDTIWPQCIECQLAAGNAGDFICMNGTDMNEREDKTSIVLKKKESSTEKPVGEWNIMEISCKSDTIEVFVNGALQNIGTGVTVNKGHICLQSEGKDIEFKNIYLTSRAD